MSVQQALDTISAYLPNLLAAVFVLVAGWLLAILLSSVLRKALERTTLDNRVAAWLTGGENVDVAVGRTERRVATAVFYLLLLFVLLAFFEVLGLRLMSQPLNQFLVQLFDYAPRLLGAGLLLIVAWLLAMLLRIVVTRGLRRTGIERLAGDESGAAAPLMHPEALGEVVFWVVIVLFLPAVLGALAIEGLLAPVQGAIDEVLRFLPNLAAAGLILLVGWLVARVVQRVVTGFSAALGIDRIGDRAGVQPAIGRQRLSGIAGFLAYALILVPVLVGALDALELRALTQPASNMLNSILAALPAILGAALLLFIAYLVGRIVAGLVTGLLGRLGANALLARFTEGGALARRPAAVVAGDVTLAAIMLFALVEALRMLGWVVAADLVAQFLVFAAQILFGLIVFAVGLYLANLAADAVAASGAEQARLLSLATRVSILVLAGAMALRQMGVANDIVNLAFALLLGAVAVATALAFGLGGREVAGRELQNWVQSARERR